MLKFERPASPDCLVAGAAEWTADYLATRSQLPPPAFSWHNKGTEIREALCAVTDRRCAYCDGPIGTESLNTIDHFKPKSKFPDHAYEWTNLFPACGVCQSHKSNKWLDGLLKPDVIGYEPQRYFRANHRTGDIEPHPNADASDQQRAVDAIGLFKLNLSDRAERRRKEILNFRKSPNNTVDDYNYRFFLIDLV